MAEYSQLMSRIKKQWLISIVGSYYCALSPVAQAQVIPDGTTANTNIVGDCLTRCEIIGGVRAANNLFHSFQQFNIRAGESIYFADPGVANIFTRITGGNGSEIFGTLGVTGNADLWLINPQGILFGNGASLDVNGSFVATTASEIVFGDRGVFSANPGNQENLPLLTVNPSAFFSHQMSRGVGIEIRETSLTIPTQENLILVGSQNNESTDAISIEGATITAPQGNIQLSAIANNETIEITPDLHLQFPQDIVGGNITLTQGSEIDVSGIGAGSVTVRAADFNILDDAIIRSKTTGNLDSGDIRIATQNLNLDRGSIYALSSGMGKSADIRIDTKFLNLSGDSVAEYKELMRQALSGTLIPGNEVFGITASTANRGAAGNITINSDNTSITNGGLIASVTYGAGKGGNIDITATETIKLSNSPVLSLSTIDSTGDTGNLTLKNQNLIVKNGGIVSASTLGGGVGGNINIEATESVELLQTPNDSLLPTSIFTNSVFPHSGDTGNLSIDTKNLTVRDGSQISSTSGLLSRQGIIPFGGAGGDINIKATESVTVSGNSSNGIFPSSIQSDTRSNNPAGNLNINTGKLLVKGQALISASSIGTGDGGNLTINATDSVTIKGIGTENLLTIIQNSQSGEEVDLSENRGGLFSVTFLDGDAGNININSPVLSLSDGASITTFTLGNGNSGNIKIEAEHNTKIISSSISSASLTKGDSGNIEIDTSNLIVRNGANVSASTLGLGKPGDIIINALNSVELANDINFSFEVLGGILSSNIGKGIQPSGTLLLNTKNLSIRNGMHIDISSQPLPQFATIKDDNALSNAIRGETFESETSIINATESITISGVSSGGTYKSSINSLTATSVPATNIQINTSKLTISDGANISVNSIGSGAAGSLDIVADSIELKNGGTLNATTLSGKGGDINLQLTDTLKIGDRSQITTNAFNRGNGGNINVDAEFVIAFPRSLITANAIAGKGGNINIKAQDIFVNSVEQISATSQLGINGKVKISTFTNDLRNNLGKLPEQVLTQKTQIISRCGIGDELGDGSFVYVGKGALPPSPLEGKIETEAFLLDWGTEFTELQMHQISRSQNSEIIEATELGVSDRGNPILTAIKNPNNLAPYNNMECPFKK